MYKKLLGLIMLISSIVYSQDYYYKKYQPFNEAIPSPSAFLGYEIGDQHTRHDMIVAYFKELARISNKAEIIEYGKTHEGRSLVMLTISNANHLSKLEELQTAHLKFVDPNQDATNNGLPIFINLGYGVHGNEPSSAEAALLTAYTLVASESSEINNYLEQAIIFIDPAINPDGRDRHTLWANMYKGSPLVSDSQDAEHNEYWPGGRTNHYWFDLNRDWLLGINPESRSKLKWFHNWYPNVVTDFHEMGTSSTYFFEPMKANASFDPIMPKENYTELNDLFAVEFSKALDSIGSLYFTKEVFDGTYPGYGSSYPDLQGGLALLFEQASSRGHVQKTAHGLVTFPFTIRNQFISSIATVKASVKNADYLRDYQKKFFKSAISNAEKNKVAGYLFNDAHDSNRLKAFIDKLLLHKIDVYKTSSENSFYVPTKQAQYRMVQTMFETYDTYRDSVYYDASAWSVANFYNIKYNPVSKNPGNLSKIKSLKEFSTVREVESSAYAYVMNGYDYNVPAFMYYLLSNKVNISAAFKPFSINSSGKINSYSYGSLVIPVTRQKIDKDTLHKLIVKGQQKFNVNVEAVKSGYSVSGIDLGSGNIRPVNMPKAAMFIGTGVRSYEAGEVWHLLDTRVGMPITKLPMRNFSRTNLDRYNVIVMVSGSYNLSDAQENSLKQWVAKGNTLITIGSASKWVIDKKMVNEKMVKEKKDTVKPVKRQPYVQSSELRGRERVGGAIFRVDIDKTHPLAFGYSDDAIPVYKNNSIWLSPSKSRFSTVAKYSINPHIDGFITKKNIENFMKHAASLIVSKSGSGRVIMFADNPNFRGSWYGTNRLFLNGLFLGNHISVVD